MKPTLPTAEQIKERLAALSYAEVQALARKTGSPMTTLWKIRMGTTTNPRLETVRAIWPALKQVKASA